MHIYYIFLLLICITCNIIRTVYEVLKYKGKIKGDNHPFFILIIFNMAILFGSWWQMSKNDPYKIPINKIFRTFYLYNRDDAFFSVNYKA